ncbi:MAG: acetylxylan esterase [Planctomycetota bacterium]|nr:acetylxylan esterase [Planctomycetota bacterium]
MRSRETFIAVLILIFSSSTLMAQFNYDESTVPAYKLPELLKLNDGSPVKDAASWKEKRRAEVLELFRSEVYGRRPGRPAALRFEVTKKDEAALGGKAIRREVRVHFTSKKNGPSMNMLLYRPAKASGSTPAFLGLNFRGNPTVSKDPGISLREGDKDSDRGKSAGRWQAEMIVERGYALATIWYGDIEPDDKRHAFTKGIHKVYGPANKIPADGWGSIAAWTWGLSRALDYFETIDEIDHKRVSVIGHSRLGKTSLWAGAEDERFALVISNNSGCGGAALNRRAFGETVKRINTSFPHWFCDNFNKYNGREGDLPVDQHMLIALMAPRPVYVASAAGDRWADPRGEYLSAKHADPVYRLLGTEGLPATKMPAVDKPSMGRIGYHIRTGKHDVTAFDWKAYLDFADKHLGRR